MVAILLFFVLHWQLSVFCQTFFLHRYGAHSQFSMSTRWQRFFYLLTYVSQGASFLHPRAYAILHRMHHAYSDTERDPHSPVYQRNLLLMGNFSFGVNKIHHDMYFNNAPWNDAASWSEGFFKLGEAAGAKTVAFLVADQEFAQNLAGGAKELANKHGLKTVYEQNYPPATVDFSSMIRAIRAAKPDIVYVMSYPNDSVAIVRAVNEIGVGDSVKLFGGAMVGLQFASIMESLGSMLNGIVFFGHQVGSFFGGWGGGKLFDLQGNYDMMWWLSIALGLISALLHWPIVEKPVARPQFAAQPA